MPAAAVMPLKPERREVGEVVGVPAGDADGDEHDQHADLDQHHDRVDGGGFAGAADQQQGAQRDQDHRGQVDDPALLRRLGQGVRDLEAEQVVQQLVQVLRPADGDRGAGDPVLQQQAAGDGHRRQLADGGVGVGVRRAGDRYRAGQFRVTDRGQPGDDPGDDERPDDRRPGDRHRLGQDEEDAGADGGADAEHRELEEPDAAGQFALARLAAGLGLHLDDGLAPEQLLAQRRHGMPPTVITWPLWPGIGQPSGKSRHLTRRRARSSSSQVSRRTTSRERPCLRRTPPGCGGCRCSCCSW